MVIYWAIKFLGSKNEKRYADDMANGLNTRIPVAIISSE